MRLAPTRRACLFIAVLGCYVSHAQPVIAPMGLGIGISGPLRMEADAADSSLYICGAFTEVEGAMSPSVTRWDGIGFHPLGCGLHGGAWDCITPGNGGASSPTTDLEFWNGELYACGAFTHSGQTALNRVARWDGTAWQPLGAGADGTVASLRAGPDGLYAAGLFNQIDTITALGLARWDGTRWHRVHDLPDITPVQGTNSIYDLAFYDGMLYIAGNFKGPLGNSIARWNGAAWEGLPGGALFAGSYSWINRLEVHDGLLYVAGVFSRSPPDGHPGNPGSGIVAFDGSAWHDLAGGTAGSNGLSVNELLWWHDTLYVAGGFDLIGGVPTDGLARWDGSRWCSLVPPGFFNLASHVIGLYRDSLHIGGIFTTAGPDSVYRVGVWAGGSYTSDCGVVGLPEPAPTTDALVAWPNPASERVEVQGVPPDAKVELVDALGRTIHRSMSDERWVRVGDLPRGLYTLIIRHGSGEVMGSVRLLLN